MLYILAEYYINIKVTSVKNEKKILSIWVITLNVNRIQWRSEYRTVFEWSILAGKGHLITGSFEYWTNCSRLIEIMVKIAATI
jgi:hypothetical protein